MDYFSIWHWLVVGVILLLLFGGRGRIPELMSDVAKGIKAFKSGIADTETSDPAIQRVSQERAVDDKRHAVASEE